MWPAFLADPGVWSFIVLVAFVAFSLRKEIFRLLTRRELSKQQHDTEHLSERRELTEKLIDNQEAQRMALTALLEDERRERKLAVERVIDGATATQKNSDQSIDVMQSALGVMRAMVDKADERESRSLELSACVVRAIDESTKVHGAVGFVLSQLFFQGQQGKSFGDVLKAMESSE